MLSGCSKPPVQLSPWRDDLKLLFPDGSVVPPEPERFLWDTDEEESLLKRAGYSDCALVATIYGVGNYSIFGWSQQLTLWLKPEEIFFGQRFLNEVIADEDRDIRFVLDTKQEDFHRALKVHRQLPSQRFVVFLKGESRPSGSMIWHWVFYRYDPTLVRELRSMYSWYYHDTKK